MSKNQVEIQAKTGSRYVEAYFVACLHIHLVLLHIYSVVSCLAYVRRVLPSYRYCLGRRPPQVLCELE